MNLVETLKDYLPPLIFLIALFVGFGLTRRRRASSDSSGSCESCVDCTEKSECTTSSINTENQQNKEKQTVSEI